MADSVQNLKKRLKSIDNISKITKAMELVAATKMRKAQEIALASRPYAFASLSLLTNLSLFKKYSFESQKKWSEIMENRKIKNILFVLIASDKGLAGSFNSSIFKKFELICNKFTSVQKSFAAVGEKSFNYLIKNNLHPIKKFINVGDYTSPEQVQPFADFLMQGYLEKKWDKVIVFSTHFQSALKQKSVAQKVLPVSFQSIQETVKEIIPDKGKFADLMNEHLGFLSEKPKNQDYLIEPSFKKVFSDLTKHLFFMQIYHLILEANASEHAARRMAMKTASDNAKDLGQTLNLEYNKLRQAGITKEIMEIISGSESLT